MEWETDHTNEFRSRTCNYLTRPRCRNKSRYDGICPQHYDLIRRLQKFPEGAERDSAMLRMVIREARKMMREDDWKKDEIFYYERAKEVLGFF